MAALRVGGELDLVDGEKIDIELARPRTVEMMFEPDFIELIQEIKRTVESGVGHTVEVE